MPSDAATTLTIGLPVFNGERYLAESIDSLLAQTFSDFRLVVADNCSSDDTPRIAHEYADSDRRVTYLQRASNIGASANYNELARAATTPYFKWAAADDIHDRTFLERCLVALDRDPCAIGAYTRAARINERSETVGFENYGLKTSASEPHVRFRSMVSRTHSCFAVFGVFRTNELQQTQLIRTRSGGDRILLAEVALLGRMIEHPAYLLRRRMHDASFSASTTIDAEDRSMFWSGDTGEPATGAPPIDEEYKRLVDESRLESDERRRCSRELRLRVVRKRLNRSVVRPLRRHVARRRR